MLLVGDRPGVQPGFGRGGGITLLHMATRRPDSVSALVTLIVFGDRDPPYPVTLATELYAAISHAYLWIVPNGGHGPIFGERASRFRETAMAFLRGDWRSKGGR